MAEEKDCYSTVSMLARRRRLQRGRRTNGGSEGMISFSLIPFLRWKQQGARNASRSCALIFGLADKFTPTVKRPRLDFRINGPFYPNGKKSLTPLIHNRQKGQLNNRTFDHDFWIKKGVDILSNSKILLPNHFLRGLGMGVGATANKCTYPRFQDLTPESILEEIWNGSRGLDLIGAPIRIFKTWWDSVKAI
jgi:hypothetical protein